MELFGTLECLNFGKAIPFDIRDVSFRAVVAWGGWTIPPRWVLDITYADAGSNSFYDKNEWVLFIDKGYSDVIGRLRYIDEKSSIHNELLNVIDFYQKAHINDHIRIALVNIYDSECPKELSNELR